MKLIIVHHPSSNIPNRNFIHPSLNGDFQWEKPLFWSSIFFHRIVHSQHNSQTENHPKLRILQAKTGDVYTLLTHQHPVYTLETHHHLFIIYIYMYISSYMFIYIHIYIYIMYILHTIHINISFFVVTSQSLWPSGHPQGLQQHHEILRGHLRGRPSGQLQHRAAHEPSAHRGRPRWRTSLI